MGPYVLRLIGAAGFSASMLWAMASNGQTTSITSSGLNTVVTQGGVTAGKQAFDITGGTRPGNGANLFHSFGEFSVGSSAAANFINETALSTSNILSRVTGGTPSNIFGEINTTSFPGANLYLINPSGVIFGQTATLNVSGSVIASTADSIRFADGRRFNAVPGPQDALLSSAPIAAFGFLGPNPKPIVIQGATLQTEQFRGDHAKALSLVGGDIVIEGATIKASGGIDLVSVAAQGEVSTEAGAGGLVPDMGRITLEDAILDTTRATEPFFPPRQAGSIDIRGGDLVMERSTANAVGEVIPGLGANSGNVTATITDTIHLTDSHIASGNQPAVVHLEAGHRIHLDNSTVESNSQKGDVIPGGAVSLHAPSIVLEGSQLNARGNRTPGEPIGLCCDTPGGSVSVQGDHIRLLDTSSVSVNGLGAGTATINATETVRLDHSQVSADTTANARPGSILISAGEAVRLNHADVSADSVAINFAAGTIVIEGGRVLAGEDSSISAKSSSPLGSEVHLSAKGTVRLDGSTIDVAPQGQLGGPARQAGTISLHAGDSVQLRNGTVLAADNAGTGNAGEIILQAGGTVVINASQITVEGRDGQAGEINMSAGEEARVINGSWLSVNNNGVGDAGLLTMEAGTTFLGQDSVFLAQTGEGHGGTIVITAPVRVRLTNSGIATGVGGSPTSVGGTIKISSQAGSLENSQVSSNAVHGTGGRIIIRANNLRVDEPSTVEAVSLTGGTKGTFTVEPFSP